MSKLIKVFNILALFIVMIFGGNIGFVTANSTFTPVGEGTELSPYQISSSDDFYEYKNLIEEELNIDASLHKYINAHYKLTNDIIFNDISVAYHNIGFIQITTESNLYYYGTGYNNTPKGYYIMDGNNELVVSQVVPQFNEFCISNFQGVIHGEGKTIKGLVNLNQGCFIDNLDSASLEQINFSDAIFGSDNNNNALIRQMTSASINECMLSGCVVAPTQQNAGFAGIMNGTSVIQNCINMATVAGNQYDAGICAVMNNKSSIQNCINKGNISSTSKYVGGIAGKLSKKLSTDDGNSTIANCINLGNIDTVSQYFGGIVSYNYCQDSIIQCYSNIDPLAGKVSSGLSIPTQESTDLSWLSDQNAYSTKFASAWDFDKIWIIVDDNPALQCFTKGVTPPTQPETPVLPEGPESPVLYDYTIKYFVENTQDDQYSLYSEPQTLSAELGQKIDIELKDIDGYHFYADHQSNNLSITITDTAENVLVAYYRLPRYTVTFVAPQPEYMSGNDVQSIKHGSTIASIPTYNCPGYVLQSWFCTTDANITLDSVITQDVTFEAVVSTQSYQITHQCENGSIIVPSSADYGESVEFSITPNTGYLPKKVLVLDKFDNPVDIQDNTFIMPASDISINVEFDLVDYTITYNTSPYYSVSLIRGGVLLDNGASVNVTDQITLSILPMD
ncbi:MAG: hypothetical protein IKC79_03145, partial [Clostridia bacterium]|nr:hypothetical protein [Clostridia bacterium]